MIRQTLKDDSVAALKAHDAQKVETLRFLISLIDKKGLQLPPDSMTEAEEIAVLRKELKNKEEAKELFMKGGRNDLVAQLDYEIGITKEYLPKEMDEAEVGKIVDEVIAEAGKNNFGMVMGLVMKKVAGKSNGEVVSKIVKEKLEKI